MEGQIMKRIAFLLVAFVGVFISMSQSGRADEEAAPIFVTKIPPGYRDWRLISVAHAALGPVLEVTVENVEKAKARLDKKPENST
jgi:hypothetical protein